MEFFKLLPKLEIEETDEFYGEVLHDKLPGRHELGASLSDISLSTTSIVPLTRRYSLSGEAFGSSSSAISAKGRMRVGDDVGGFRIFSFSASICSWIFASSLLFYVISL